MSTNPILGGGGFHHVCMKTRDWDATMRFSKDTLGCTTEKIAWREAPQRAVMLDAGDGNYIEVFEDLAYASAATGAILSQGSNISTPATFMAALAGQTQNWFTFLTTFDPVVADKVAFAQWSNSVAPQFLYCMGSYNIALTTNSYASTAWGQIQAAAYQGVLPIYDPNLLTDNNLLAAFAAGFFASLNFAQTNGRQALAYQSGSGVTASVNSGTIAAQLILNGVSYYGITASGSSQFNFFYNGAVSGKFLWADTYAQAVWLASNLQVAGLTLLTSVGNIPYNAQGAGLIDAAFYGPISAAVNFGAIRAGVTLSALQIAEVNNAAGIPIDQTLFQRGWYLQIGIASAPVRAARQSPPMTLWYCDGESVQNISLASLVIE